MCAWGHIGGRSLYVGGWLFGCVDMCKGTYRGPFFVCIDVICEVLVDVCFLWCVYGGSGCDMEGSVHREGG